MNPWLSLLVSAVSCAVASFFLHKRTFKRAFAAGVRFERESHERMLEKVIWDRAGIKRKPGESAEELRARVNSHMCNSPGSRAHARAQLEDLKPVGMSLEKWVDSVLGRTS